MQNVRPLPRAGRTPIYYTQTSRVCQGILEGLLGDGIHFFAVLVRICCSGTRSEHSFFFHAGKPHPGRMRLSCIRVRSGFGGRLCSGGCLLLGRRLFLRGRLLIGRCLLLRSGILLRGRIFLGGGVFLLGRNRGCRTPIGGSPLRVVIGVAEATLSSTAAQMAIIANFFIWENLLFRYPVLFTCPVRFSDPARVRRARNPCAVRWLSAPSI